MTYWNTISNNYLTISNSITKVPGGPRMTEQWQESNNIFNNDELNQTSTLILQY